MIEIPVQINGKTKSIISVPIGIDAAELEKIARKDSAIDLHLKRRTIIKVVVIPNVLVNFLTR